VGIVEPELRTKPRYTPNSKAGRVGEEVCAALDVAFGAEAVRERNDLPGLQPTQAVDNCFGHCVAPAYRTSNRTSRAETARPTSGTMIGRRKMNTGGYSVGKRMRCSKNSPGEGRRALGV
jgi:hypothetical protein